VIRPAIAGTACALLCVLPIGCTLGGVTNDGPAVITRVVDGDTVVVDVGGRRETVRLVGIDAPESVHPTRPIECFGPEASSTLSSLLPVGTEVVLERDVEARDPYDRLLAYVLRASDSLNVNIELVSLGAAVPLVIPPNTAYRDQIADAAVAARREQRGLWAVCTP
jgi:micrococcal nuclease